MSTSSSGAPAAEAAPPPTDLLSWIERFNAAGQAGRAPRASGQNGPLIRLVVQPGTYRHLDPDAPDGHSMVWVRVDGFPVNDVQEDSIFAPYYLLCDCQIKQSLGAQGKDIAKIATACPYVQGQCRTRLLTLAHALDQSRGSNYLETHVITGGSQEAADRALLMVLAGMVMKGVFVGNAIGGHLTIDDLLVVFADRCDEDKLRNLLLALEKASLINTQTKARTVFIRGALTRFLPDLQRAFPKLIPE